MEQSIQTTTSDDLYKVLFDKKCTKYKEFVDSDYSKFAMENYVYDGNLKGLMDYRERLQSLLSSVKNYVVPTISFNADVEINAQFSEEIAKYDAGKKELEDDIEAMREEDLIEFERKCSQEKARVASTVAPIKEKHDRLISYKEKLSGVMDHYGVSASDIKIDPNITRAEFEEFLDEALKTCEEFDGKSNQLLDLILAPLEEDDDMVVICYSVFVLLVCKVGLPILAVVYIFLMLKNTRNIYDKLDNLQLAESLMYTVDYDKFIPESEQYVEPVHDTQELEETISMMLADYEKKDPRVRLNQELRKYKSDAGLTYVGNGMNNMYNEAKARKQTIEAEIQVKLTEVEQLIAEERSKLKALGDVMNKSTVMNTTYTIGYVHDTIPVTADIGLTNINFIGTYSPDLLKYLKVMFVNILLSTRANSLQVKVFDEEYLGQAFSEFITPHTAPYIELQSKDLPKLWEEAQKNASANILAIKTQTILDYNKKSEELGMLTRPYYLYIILTGLSDKFKEDKPIMEFLKYSAERGIIVWTVYNQKLPGCKNVVLPISIPEGKPIEYDFDLGARAVGTMEYDLENNKVRALDYRKGYLLPNLQPEKWWQASAIKGVNIRLGLQNGDPSKAYLMYFDDKNVHFLLGGATGSGKSVAIDCALQNMIHEYPPDELQLVYIDLKNAEVQKYVTDGLCNIPHVLIASGTTDGEYCLSIFEWAYDEMVRRLSVCGKYNTQKVEDMRKKYDDPSREDYNPEVHIPRTVILIDEFQVMFNSTVVPQKIIDKISGKMTSLTKLARAASMHLWFTSQDMSGTLSANTLANFSTRGALRSTREISSALLGNDAAGHIKDKVGWMYTNDSAGQDPNANRLWKVPYAPGDDLLLGVTELEELCGKMNKKHLHAKFFDEKEGKTRADLVKAYEDFPDFKDPYRFVLGERTQYSVKPTPANIMFSLDDKENLFIAAFERQDVTDLVGTILTNIQLKEGAAKILINSADKDTIFLLNLEQYMPEGWEDFLSPSRSLDELFDDFEELCEMREEDGADVPLYMMWIMWEKKEYVGIDENYKKLETLNKYIKRMNDNNIHIIMVSRDRAIPRSLINVCTHRIAAKINGTFATSVVDDFRPETYPVPDGDNACFAMYKYGSDDTKFKLYRHKLERELVSREL